MFLDNAAPAADADVVIEEVEPAKPLDRVFDESAASVLAGNIGGVGCGRAAFRLDHLDSALGQFEAAVDHQYLRAGASQ